MITCPKCHHEASDDAKFCGNCATPLSQSKKEEDPFVGKCIDHKYYVLKRIASGGMGVVYLARQKGVGQDVAIKKLHPEHYRNEKIVQRLITEARSYAQISHPNAVKLHDLLNVNGQICIVMEYVHGKTLTHYIESGYVFSIRQIIDISLQLADALATVHKEGIIHRDLKTENVMLMETIPGRFSVKILDFGIAKILDRPNVKETQTGVIVGTPEFMSPEQCFGLDVDYRTDIYGFGILMFVMICGKLPYTAETAIAMLHKQINAPMPPCERPDQSEVPSDLQAIVRKCTEKKRENRYQNFIDIITDLTCLQEGKPSIIARTVKSNTPNKDNDPTQISKSDKNFPVTERALIPFALDKEQDSKDNKNHLFKLPSFSIDEESNSTLSSYDINLDSIESAAFSTNSEASELSLGEDNSTPKQETISNSLDSESQSLDSESESLDSDCENPFSIGDDVSDSSEDSSEGGEFSLGDIDEIDVEEEEEEEPKGKSHIWFIAIVIIAAIVGIIVFQNMRLSEVEEANTTPAMPTALSSSVATDATNDTPSNLPQAAETQPSAPGTSETADAAVPENADKSAQPEIPEVEAPPSQVASYQVLERGVLRATMIKLEQQLNNGQLAEAEKLSQFLLNKKEYLLNEDATKYATLEETKTLFNDTMKQADKARRSGRCESITALIAPLPVQAQGLRDELSKQATKCLQIQAAPPSTL